jgi:hypothetical protein
MNALHLFLRRALRGSAALALAALSACKPEILDPVFPEPVWEINKLIEFQIYADAVYAEPLRDSVTAEVRLAVATSLRDGTQQSVWDTVLSARPLRDFPRAVDPVIVRRQIRGLDTRTHDLQTSWGIIYRYRNTVHQEFRNELPPLDNSPMQIQVGI